VDPKTSHRQAGDVTIRSTWTAVEGVRLHALAGGEGPPVVLVHGYGVSGAYMRPLARVLGRSHSVYAPDLPDRSGIPELSRALECWLDAVSMTRPAVVANSMGCQIVTELAARRPARIGPLVLVGPTVDPARRGARHQLCAALRDSAREPWSLLALAARNNARVDVRPLLATARAALRDRIEDRLPPVRQRAVVVFGEEDGFVGREWAERAAALLPRGRLVVVPGEPHAVHYTRPRLVADIVVELLAEKREDAVGDCLGSLEHRNVPAIDVDDPRARQGSVPFLGDGARHEAVAVAPDE
jgi:2-hydroxy-6-oxonona-2,4-dienedioate hydrolase